MPESFELEIPKNGTNAKSSEHKDHDIQHTFILIILLLVIFLSQTFLLYARKYHPHRYQVVTLTGLWFIPPFMALMDGLFVNLRFLSVWTIFTLGNALIVRKSFSRPLGSMTPRLVYSWFRRLYQMCYAVGVLGYTLIITDVVGISRMLLGPPADPTHSSAWLQIGLLLFFYGVYFGILGRDLVELLSIQMASSIGYYSKAGFPNKHLRENVCAVCGDQVDGKQQPSGAGQQVVLNCRHVFHEECLRGWCIVGKKDMCPYCKEKVSLDQFRRNPWETQEIVYLQLLDWVRYFVVWQPVVLITAQIIIRTLGLH